MVKETKTASRGRPKKSFDSVNKILKEKNEKKGKKLGRGRPPKNICNKDTDIVCGFEKINLLDTKCNKTWNIEKIGGINLENNIGGSKSDTFILKILAISIVSIVFALLTCEILTKYTKIGIDKTGKIEDIVITEISQDQDIELGNTVADNIEKDKLNEDNSIFQLEHINDNIDYNSDEMLILDFYENLNELDITNMNKYVDSYLKKTDTYRTYFSKNWLGMFLDKLETKKVYISDFVQDRNVDKQNVRSYTFTVQYILKGTDNVVHEDWAIKVINRGGGDVIGSIMCITTGCSKMPFFQK